MLKSTKYLLLFAPLSLLLLVSGCGRRKQTTPVETAPERETASAPAKLLKDAPPLAHELQQRAPTNAQEMLTQRMYEVEYREALDAATGKRNEHTIALNKLRAEMAKIEAASTNNSAAAEALAGEIASLMEQLEAKEQQLDALALYKQDPEWIKLDAEAKVLQDEVKSAQGAIQKIISERMRKQYAAMRASPEGQKLRERVIVPAMPMPPPQNTNQLVSVAELQSAPKTVVQPLPPRGGTSNIVPPWVQEMAASNLTQRLQTTNSVNNSVKEDSEITVETVAE